MVMATGTDDTIVNIADGTNSIVGSASNITIGQKPGAAGEVIFDDNSSRSISGAFPTLALNSLLL